MTSLKGFVRAMFLSWFEHLFTGTLSGFVDSQIEGYINQLEQQFLLPAKATLAETENTDLARSGAASIMVICAEEHLRTIEALLNALRSETK